MLLTWILKAEVWLSTHFFIKSKCLSIWYIRLIWEKLNGYFYIRSAAVTELFVNVLCTCVSPQTNVHLSSEMAGPWTHWPWPASSASLKCTHGWCSACPKSLRSPRRERAWPFTSRTPSSTRSWRATAGKSHSSSLPGFSDKRSFWFSFVLKQE